MISEHAMEWRRKWEALPDHEKAWRVAFRATVKEENLDVREWYARRAAFKAKWDAGEIWPKPYYSAPKGS